MAKSNYHWGSKGQECYFCGDVNGVEEHHIIPQRFDGPDDRDNIVDVCGACHNKLERLYDSAFYNWFGIEDKSNRRRFHRACAVHSCSNTVDFEFIDPTSGRGSKIYLCLECAREWFERKWVYILKQMWGDGLGFYISKSTAEMVRESRTGEMESGPLTETGVRKQEIEKLGWENCGVGKEDSGLNIVEGEELPGMSRFEMLVDYSVSFSPRIGERVEQ